MSCTKKSKKTSELLFMWHYTCKNASKLTLVCDCLNHTLWTIFPPFLFATLPQSNPEFLAGIFVSLLHVHLNQRNGYTAVWGSFSFLETISNNLFLITWKDIFQVKRDVYRRVQYGFVNFVLALAQQTTTEQNSKSLHRYSCNKCH